MGQKKQIFYGKAASSGQSIGAIDLIQKRLPSSRHIRKKNAPPVQETLLENAIDQAVNDLTQLIQTSDKLGAQILQLQLLLLKDPELTNPIYAQIRQGESAITSWENTLNFHIEDYVRASDKLFQSRANDFVDIRNRVLRYLKQEVRSPAEQSNENNLIFIAEDIMPSQFLELDWSRYVGIAIVKGSVFNHVSMLARARQIPFLIRMPKRILSLSAQTPVILDCDNEKLIYAPDHKTLRKFERSFSLSQQSENGTLLNPVVTGNGRQISVFINVDDLRCLDDISPENCEGVGLARSELMFFQTNVLPNEETQFRAYKKLLGWAGDKPVTIRTFDAGGDKGLFGLFGDQDQSSSSGMRGIRLLLSNPDIFRVQIRALARAAVFGNLKVLIPMVTISQEIEATRKQFFEEIERLRNENKDARMPALGMMVETPAAAIMIESFDVDFFAIGSNDLAQFIMATSRDCHNVEYLQDPANPAVLKVIRDIAEYADANNKQVCICGEMASSTDLLPTLLNLGIKNVSVPTMALARVKAAIIHEQMSV